MDVPSLGGRTGVAVGVGVRVSVAVGVGVGETLAAEVGVAVAAPGVGVGGAGTGVGELSEGCVALGRGVFVAGGVGVRVPAIVPVVVGFDAADTDGPTVGFVFPSPSWMPSTWLDGVASKSSMEALPCCSCESSWGRRDGADWSGGGGVANAPAAG